MNSALRVYSTFWLKTTHLFVFLCICCAVTTWILLISLNGKNSCFSVINSVVVSSYSIAGKQ